MNAVQRVIGATTTVFTAVGIVGIVGVFIAAPTIIGMFQDRSSQGGCSVPMLSVWRAGFSFLTIWVGILEAIPQAVHRFDLLAKVQAGILSSMRLV